MALPQANSCFLGAIIGEDAPHHKGDGRRREIADLLHCFQRQRSLNQPLEEISR
jgi:hypothetical protein